MLNFHLIIPTVCTGIVSSLVARTLCEGLSIAEPWRSTFSGALVACAVLGVLWDYQRRMLARQGLTESKCNS